MVVPALTYIVLAVSGVIGSVIAWEDLKGLLKSKTPKAQTKQSCQ